MNPAIAQDIAAKAIWQVQINGVPRVRVESKIGTAEIVAAGDLFFVWVRFGSGAHVERALKFHGSFDNVAAYFVDVFGLTL